MAKGARKGKGPNRRPRKSVGRARSPSTGRKTQTTSAAKGGERGVEGAAQRVLGEGPVSDTAPSAQEEQ